MKGEVETNESMRKGFLLFLSPSPPLPLERLVLRLHHVGANGFLLTCKTLQASSCVVFLRFTPFTSRILSPWWIDPSLYAMLSSDWNKRIITYLNNLVPFQSIRVYELWGHADLVNRRPSPARQGPVFLSIARGRVWRSTWFSGWTRGGLVLANRV